MAETVLSNLKLVLNAKGELALVLDTVDNKQMLEVLKAGEYYEFAHIVASVHRHFNSKFEDLDSD